MRNVRAAVALAALAVVPALAFAQQRAGSPKVELGMDLGLQYTKPSGGDGYFAVGSPVSVVESGFLAPVVLRLGVLTATKLSYELRFTGGMYSSSSSGGGTVYTVGPGLNLVYRLSGKGHADNTYFTGGAAVDLIGSSGGGSSNSYAFFTFNAGIGLRRPWGASGASRAEAFFAYTLKNTKAEEPNTIHFGLRLGFSLFK